MGNNCNNRQSRHYSQENNNHINNDCELKNHNHEFLSSTDYEKDRHCIKHNHRIAGMTGPAIKCDGSHVHKIEEFTDTFRGHYHEICDTTGPAIFLPDGKHVHVVKGQTTCDNGHKHDYYFTTLIENPTFVPVDEEC